jgi:hypothetical protein
MVRFRRLDDKRRVLTTAERGTGFGLSIVDEIVEASGWQLTETDVDSGGARFEIRTSDAETEVPDTRFRWSKSNVMCRFGPACCPETICPYSGRHRYSGDSDQEGRDLLESSREARACPARKNCLPSSNRGAGRTFGGGPLSG